MTIIGRLCSTVLLRIFLTCLFCGIGYGLMQLPSMVVAYRQGSAGSVKNTCSTIKADPPAQGHSQEVGVSSKEEFEGPADSESASRPATAAAKTDIRSDPLTEALKAVIDPELGVSIVDLGLIRNIEDHGSGNVTLTMIPTSPLCPYLKYLVAEIKKIVPEQTSYKTVSVKIDLQQRWTPDYLSEQGRRHFFGAKL